MIITHETICRHCGETLGRHSASGDHCPKIVLSLIEEDHFMKQTFAPKYSDDPIDNLLADMGYEIRTGSSNGT